MKIIWYMFLKYKVQQIEIFVILGHFFHFQPLTTQKIKIWKLKKTPGDITILHICTINDNHMMYGSWDMEYDRQNFLSFWTILCPFTPLWTQKIKNSEKMKQTPDDIIILQEFFVCPFTPPPPPSSPWQPEKLTFWKNKENTWRYYHFTHVYHKWQSYDVWFLRYEAWQNFLSFCSIFCPFTQPPLFPKKPEKMKFWKNEKNTWRHHDFTQVYQKSWSYVILFLRYGLWRM